MFTRSLREQTDRQTDRHTQYTRNILFNRSFNVKFLIVSRFAYSMPSNSMLVIVKLTYHLEVPLKLARRVRMLKAGIDISARACSADGRSSSSSRWLLLLMRDVCSRCPFSVAAAVASKICSRWPVAV